MQGERVVLAQVLLMHHVEAGVMDARFDEAGRAEITVREDNGRGIRRYRACREACHG